MPKESVWTFDVNYITWNNSYVQVLATLCVFQPLLRDLRQASNERFMKLAVVRDFFGTKMSVPLALHYQKLGSASGHRLLPFLPCITRQLG